MIPRALTITTLATLAAATAARGQQNAVPVTFSLETGNATAVPADPRPPAVDGILDDAAWESAPVYRGFWQRDPAEGEPATEPTEFRVVYTATALYVAVRSFDSRPEEISAILARRDDRTPSDEVVVMIDSDRDRRTGYLFALNAAGVKRDAFLYDDNRDDERWDAVWEGRAAIDSLGWTAEFRIPYSQLRIPGSGIDTVGFNVSRTVARLNEEQYWRLAPKTAQGVVSLFGELGGLGGITPPRRLEIQPYTLARLERGLGQPGNPFDDGSRQAATAGADVRFGLGSAFTVTATVNPDFGQVEADPAEVNLSAFESFFRERRPFFTEGLDLYQFDFGGRQGYGGSEGLFYSRRIGRSPQGRPDARGGYAEDVGQTTILGAAKLSGKTGGGWTLGVMSALTDEETASVVDSAGAAHADPVEPRTGYVVARLAKDLRQGRTVIGAFGTTVQRRLDDDLSFLHSAAYTGGIDLSHRFRNDAYLVSARVLGSSVRGSPEAIARTQRSSARLYQRPDRDDGRYDPTRTSLEGYGYAVRAQKVGGGAWRWDTGIERRSPGLEVNDIGFMRQADRTQQWASVTHNWFRPGPVFRFVSLSLSQSSEWTHDFQRRDAGIDLNSRFTLRNYWGGWIGVGYERGGIAPEQLRGGPAIDRAGEYSVRMTLRSDGRKAVRVGGSSFLSFAQDSPSWRARLGTEISWRPASNLDVSAEPGVTLNRNAWQYLRTLTFGGAPQYVLGDLRQETVSMELRASAVLSPTLSIQMYAEPFVSTGRYASFSRVANPRAGRFQDQFETFADAQVLGDGDGVRLDLDADGAGDLALGTPDFRVLSFRSNVVLRWEYSLGSTFFLVWQHGRSDRGDDGRFRIGSSVGDLLATGGENVLLVKLNYWLNP